MHTDINECSEIRNVSDSTLKLHSGNKILHIHNVCAEHRRRKLVSGVSCRLDKLFDNIVEGRNADSELFCGCFGSELLNLCLDIFNCFRADIGSFISAE